MNKKIFLPNAASFLISEDCNLACTYCFELEGHRNVHMTKEIARKGVKYLCDNALANGDNEFSVMFFGGEPLLKPDVVEEVFIYGLELAEKHNINFSTSMVTNATLLDDNIKRIIRTYKDRANLSIQLSVDGIKEIHDKYRVTRGGKGSFDTIENNIPEWKELFKDDMWRLSVHGCSNQDTLPFLFENFLFFRQEWNIPRIWFMPIHSEEWSRDDVKVYEEQLNLIVDYVLADAKRTGNIDEVLNYSPIDRCLSPDSFPSAPCGAGKNFCTITATGELYPCHQMYFNDPDKITKIGDLDTGIDELKRKLYVEYDNTDLSCAKIDPNCDAYHCYRCIAENLQQNGSILSTVDCQGNRCMMSKVERKIQLKVKRELERMGLIHNNSNNGDCSCDNRQGHDGVCDVVVQCEGNTRGLNGKSNAETLGNKESCKGDCQCKEEELTSDNDTIAMALKMILEKIDLIEKEQAVILKKLL